MKKTKCVDLSKPDNKPTPKKGVEFTAFLSNFNVREIADCKPCYYEVVELITRSYNEQGEDVMFAYSANDRKAGTVYFGKWNDGVVK